MLCNNFLHKQFLLLTPNPTPSVNRDLTGSILFPRCSIYLALNIQGATLAVALRSVTDGDSA